MKQAVEHMFDGDILMIMTFGFPYCPYQGHFQCFAEHFFQISYGYCSDDLHGTPERKIITFCQFMND